MTTRPSHDLIEPAEAAMMLKVSTRTLARYRREGRLACKRYSRRKILYLRSDLERFIEDAHVEPLPYDL